MQKRGASSLFFISLVTRGFHRTPISPSRHPVYIRLWNNGQRSDNVNNKCGDEADQVGASSAKLNVGHSVGDDNCRRRTAADVISACNKLHASQARCYRGQTHSQQDGLISSKLQNPRPPSLLSTSRLRKRSQQSSSARCETNWRQIERYSWCCLYVFPNRGFILCKVSAEYSMNAWKRTFNSLWYAQYSCCESNETFNVVSPWYVSI